MGVPVTDLAEAQAVLDKLKADLAAMTKERDEWRDNSREAHVTIDDRQQQLAAMAVGKETWRKEVIAADKTIAKQAVLIEALQELAKMLEFGRVDRQVAALENVKAAQRNLDKETS